jgi:hypothetical protein
MRRLHGPSKIIKTATEILTPLVADFINAIGQEAAADCGVREVPGARTARHHLSAAVCT